MSAGGGPGARDGRGAQASGQGGGKVAAPGGKSPGATAAGNARPEGGKLSTDGGVGLGQNPFAALSGLGLPAGPAAAAPAGAVGAAGPAGAGKAGAGKAVGPTAPQKNRGRVEVLRSTAGRGGKTVLVVRGFTGIGQPEKEQLAKAMQKACGTGGTVKDGQIEIQGDQRETVLRILTEAGFRPVWAGG